MSERALNIPNRHSRLVLRLLVSPHHAEFLTIPDFDRLVQPEILPCTPLQ